MITAGGLLRSERLKKGLSLEEAEKAIKIRRKFLEALETGDYQSLPPAAFTRGFVKNYASFLGLNTDEVLAFYRRETSAEKARVLPEQVGKINQKFSLTPQFFTAFGIGLLLFLFFLYLLRQYLLFSAAPFLAIDKPSDFSVVNTSPLEISGKTDPDVAVSINNQLISLDPDGSFSLKIDLSPGLNTFTIIAQNKYKKQSQVLRHVRLESP